MRATRLLVVCLLLGLAWTLPGCTCVPKSRLTQSESEKRILAEQCQAQLAEIENLRIHSRSTTDKLMQVEQDLAMLQDEVGVDRGQLSAMQRERAQLHDQFKGLANGRARVPPEVAARLSALAQRYPSLQFDPSTGISKLDTDVLFDTGSDELKAGAEQMLGELAQVLGAPEASDLKVLVVGHTDSQQIAGRSVREKFADNFRLSTARAHAVADRMRRLGMSEQRLGVAGFGSGQPVAPNGTPQDRQKNRRVEIFVMNQDAPVVGWTDSIPSLY